MNGPLPRLTAARRYECMDGMVRWAVSADYSGCWLWVDDRPWRLPPNGLVSASAGGKVSTTQGGAP